ncbi:MBL fold metallo-hydrolase [Planctomicrobium sp. SH668]|uniref:MBL fold metallo-hydrolase n=1 Tax=Planctomicrobium sp. SH668 TaxID=3448126 RepID=UPI003F5B292D
MKIELLGTGGYYANARRQTACILFPEHGIVLDAGSALYRFSQRCSAKQIHLFLTHPHHDHISGLPFLLVPVLQKTLENVTLYANDYTHKAIKDHLFSEAVFPVPVPYKPEVLTDHGGMRLTPGVSVRWQPLPSHPGGSVAYRFEIEEAGRSYSIAYVTDTTVDGSYTDFIRGSDLLIHECYFGDENQHFAEMTGHSHTSAVGEIAKEAGVQRLIVVHIDPNSESDDVVDLPLLQSIFPQSIIGTDGFVMEL